MKIVQLGQVEHYKLSNMCVDGLSMSLQIEAAAVNVPITIADLNLTQTNIKITLRRGGKLFQLVSGTLGILGVESMLQEAVCFSNENAAQKITILASGAAVKEICVVPLPIQLGSPINLTGSDELDVEVNFGSSTVGGTIGQGTQTFLMVAEHQTVGIERGTPYIVVETLNAQISNFNLRMPDNVKSIAYINLDKNDTLTASSPINSIGMSSKTLNQSWTFQELMTNRAYQVSEPTKFAALKHNHFLPLIQDEGVDYDDVKIDITLNSANVNSAQNAIVYRYLYIDARIIARAEATEHHVQVKRFEKVGLPVDSKYKADVMNARHNTSTK